MDENVVHLQRSFKGYRQLNQWFSAAPQRKNGQKLLSCHVLINWRLERLFGVCVRFRSGNWSGHWRLSKGFHFIQQHLTARTTLMLTIPLLFSTKFSFGRADSFRSDMTLLESLPKASLYSCKCMKRYTLLSIAIERTGSYETEAS